MQKILLSLAVAAIAAPAVAQPAKTTTTLANPAATFCVENGGVYEIKESGTGDKAGVCVFSDGAEIDAWEFLRAHFDNS